MRSSFQSSYSMIAGVICGALISVLPASAILPEPGNIFYGLARGFWGQPLTPQDGAVVIMRRASTASELARSEIIDGGHGGPNFILRPSLDDGVGLPYSPFATVPGERVQIVISIRGILYPALGGVPAIGGRAVLRELGLVANDDFAGNGLSDSWEVNCCGGIGVDPSADYDKDGVNNLGEFQAGTDPLDAQSVLRIESVFFTGQALTLEWTRITGRTYVLEWQDALSNGWQPVPANRISGTHQNTVDLFGKPGGFFRIRLEPWWP